MVSLLIYLFDKFLLHNIYYASLYNTTNILAIITTLVTGVSEVNNSMHTEANMLRFHVVHSNDDVTIVIIVTVPVPAAILNIVNFWHMLSDNIYYY